MRQHAGAGYDRFQFVWRDSLAEDAFDRGDLLLGVLDPLADGGAQNDAELAFVRNGEKFRSDLWDQRERDAENEQDPYDEDSAMGEDPAQRPLESTIQRVVALSAPIHETQKPNGHRAVGVLFRLEKFVTERGGNRA